MICPRCSIVEVPPDGNRCHLCGLVLVPARAPAPAFVSVGGNGDGPGGGPAPADDFQARVADELGEIFELQALWSQQDGRAVFLAQDTVREHAVVLKVIGKDVPGRPYVRDFRRDAAQACRVTHPHLVPVIDFGTTRSFLWHSREYVTGRTLADLLRETGPMKPAACRRLAEQLGETLDHMHDNGVVHGKVTASNIIIQTVNGEQWARLTDVSVVHSATGSIWQDDYVAPEQFSAEHTPESVDQYALASVLYQSLTGAEPFDGVLPHGSDEASSEPRSIAAFREDVQPMFVWAVHRALSVDPDDRFRNVTEFTSALGEVHEPQKKAVVQAVEALVAKREPRVLIVDKAPRTFPFGGVAVGAAVVFLGVTVTQSLRPQPDSSEWVTIETTEATPIPVTPPPPAPAQVETASAAGSTEAARDGMSDSLPAASSSAPARAAPPPPVVGAPGTLFVNSTPWGQLFVDGTSLGNTPKANLTVTPGTHLIRIVRYGFVTFEQEIDVAPGQVIRLTDIVLEARQP